MKTFKAVFMLACLSICLVFAATPAEEEYSHEKSLIPLAKGNEWTYRFDYFFRYDSAGVKMPVTPENREYSLKIQEVLKLEDIQDDEDSTDFYVISDSVINEDEERILYGYIISPGGISYIRLEWEDEDDYDEEYLRFFPYSPSENVVKEDDNDRFYWKPFMFPVATPSGTFNCYRAAADDAYEYYCPGVGLVMREEVFIHNTKKPSIILKHYRTASDSTR